MHDFTLEKLSTVKTHYITNNLVGNTILDVGAGNCYYGQYLLKNNKDLAITALDLEQVQDLEGITFIQANLENPLSFLKDESFNTILAFDIIEHVNQEQQLLHELFRIGTQNSVLIGSVPHDDDKFLPAYNLTFKHRSDITHKRYYTPPSLKSALQQAGFKNITVQLEGGVSPHVFAEFFPTALHYPIKKLIGLLRRIKLINANKLSSDLMFVARK